MFYTPLSNPALKRTLRPIYAQHQATTYGGFLDPNWDKAFDIVPGTVMCRATAEVFTPFCPGNTVNNSITGKPQVGAGANAKPFGLAALWMAPKVGVDEVTPTGSNVFTTWVGGEQAVFEILAPGFDTTANWTATNVTDGGYQLLTANAQGLLTPTGATNENAIAELVDVEDAGKILVRLNRFSFSSSVGTSAS